MKYISFTLITVKFQYGSNIATYTSFPTCVHCCAVFWDAKGDSNCASITGFASCRNCHRYYCNKGAILPIRAFRVKGLVVTSVAW